MSVAFHKLSNHESTLQLDAEQEMNRNYSDRYCLSKTITKNLPISGCNILWKY